MERFGIQEANGTAYIELTCKLFIRCAKQFKKGLFKSYNFFCTALACYLDFSVLLPILSQSLEEELYYLIVVFAISCPFLTKAVLVWWRACFYTGNVLT